MHPLVCGVPGLADLLKISVTSAARRAREGTVPGVKIGREWRFWTPAVVAVVTGTIEADADTEMPGLVHAEDLAELLGIHANTMRRLLRRGQVPGRRVGGTWMAHWPSVCRWIAAGGRPSSPECDRETGRAVEGIGGCGEA